jgi:hypothetical protein
MISRNRSQTPTNKLEQIKKRLDAWRKTRKRRGRIPDRLWKSAAEVAEHYGLNKTAKALHLDYNALKKRLKTMPDGNESSPAFIELISPPASSSTSECLIELEAPHGEKMRIHLKGTALPDLAAMGNMFWRNKQ